VLVSFFLSFPWGHLGNPEGGREREREREREKRLFIPM